MKLNKIFKISAVALLIIAQCKKHEKLKITGSETMHPMMNVLAGDYMKKNKKILVEVLGGGSQEGIDSLILGKTNIAVTSRGLIEKELLELQKKGKIEQLTVAYDGTAVVVHPKNAIDKVDLETTAKIFSGKITNWKELGGQDEKIIVVIRNEKSGTGFYFKEHIIRKLDIGAEEYRKARFEEYVKSAKVFSDNDEIANFIAKYPNSIGFMGMGSAEVGAKGKVKPLRYSRTPDDEAIVPNIENVYNRKYKLSRPLYLVYITNSNLKTMDFISFASSEEGQKSIAKSGYLRSTLPELEVKGIYPK